MIGIAQHERGVDVFEVFGGQGLDGGLRPNRCEDWGNQVTVRCGEYPCAGAVVIGVDFKFKHRADYTLFESMKM